MMPQLCEVCLNIIEETEDNDGCTEMCEVCERGGFCARCALPENHDCEEEDDE